MKEQEILIDIDLNTIKAFCHTFIRGNSKSLCGVPRQEQAYHGSKGVAGLPLGKFCSGCGLENCPNCTVAYNNLCMNA